MTNPFAITGPAVLNVSGGRTSALMLRRVLDAHGGRLPANVHAVFCNTGKEREETLSFLNRCAQEWSVQIRWVERAPDVLFRWREVDFGSASRNAEPFDRLIIDKSFLPNAVMRFCTQELKIVPARNFMLAHGYEDWVSVVGLRADEPSRVARIRQRDHGQWTVACPLFDAGVTRQDVDTFWKSQPFGLLKTSDLTTPVQYVDEDIDPEPLNPSEIEMSKGCPRRCLFCIHPWRHRYQEAPKDVVKEFIRTRPGKGVGLVSNSSDDVSYYDEIADFLTATGKTDMVVSNAVQGLTEEVVSQRKREMLLGVEGMSERLRWIVNKPIPRDVLRAKIDLCLHYGKQIRTVMQFNLPGEEMRDFDEFEADVAYFRRRYAKGSWAAPFIPNQPSAHTPFQWVVPRYSVDMQRRIMEFRKSMFGSNKTGIAFYSPAPLGPAKWFSQVIAEWIPITPKVADAVEKLPTHADVPTMVQALGALGVTLPREFLHRDEHTAFPWSNIVTTGDDPDKWRRYAGMVRKINSARYREAFDAAVTV